MAYEMDHIAHSPVFKNPRQYADAKITILEEDFCITPTIEEKSHLYTLTTQISIDNGILSIINHHWDN